MNELFKLTDAENKTRNVTWRENMTFSVELMDRKPELCSKGVIHAYQNPNLALLLNPAHGNFKNPKLWACTGDVVVTDWGKCGCYMLTMGKNLPHPEWYDDEAKRAYVMVQFAVLCAESVLPIFEASYPKDNRPRKAIEAAKEYLRAKTDAAADAAADAAHAAHVAYAADAAADAAAYAAYAAHAAHAADAAAYAATYAAYAAAYAATYAAYAADIGDLDFGYIADKAVELVQEKGA
jgi:hypothetical protein